MEALDNLKLPPDVKSSGVSGSGGVDFKSAFEATFDILDASIQADKAVNCNTAILLFASSATQDSVAQAVQAKEQDGSFGSIAANDANYNSYNHTATLAYIEDRTAQTQALNDNKPILFFPFLVVPSKDLESTASSSFPFQLACSVELGVTATIYDETTAVTALNTYYQLFALGLGASPANRDYVLWVEPYEYFTPGLFGTTVSVPVYDDAVTPPLFLGVVGIDFSLEALEAALKLGLEIDDSVTAEEAVRRVVEKTTAYCPAMDFSSSENACLMESFRRHWGMTQCPASTSSSSLCSDDDIVSVTEESCPDTTIFPTNVWANTKDQGVAYEDRTCCLVGETTTSDECPVLNAEGSDCHEGISIDCVAGTTTSGTARRGGDVVLGSMPGSLSIIGGGVILLLLRLLQ